MKHPVTKSLCLFALILGACGQIGAANWDGLKQNSPFGQPPAAPTQPTGEYEFRGVVREDDITLVNVFNTATQKSQWIPVEGQLNGIAANSYDSAGEKLQITAGGRELTLPLKKARVALVQAAPTPPPQQSGGQPNPNASANVAQPNAGQAGGAEAQQAFRNLPPEARSMIEEIRRRRALRAQQAQQNASGDNQPARAPNSQP